MDALETLLSVRERGARVWVEEGQLRFEAPRGAMRPCDLQQLRRFKDELIALICGHSEDFGPALEPRRADDVIPWTPLQASLGRRSTPEGAPRPRHFAFAVRLRGALRVAALEAALERVRARHDILRTRFVWPRGVAIQSIDPFVTRPLVVIDLSQIGRAAAAEKLQQVIEAFRGIEVRAQEGPLFDARLLRVTDADHVLVVSLDQMITDCKSTDLLNREIWQIYTRLARGQAAEAEHPALQLADYAVWLEKGRSDWVETHWVYWQERFPELPPTHASPVRRADHESLINVSMAVKVEEGLLGELLAWAHRQQRFPAVITLAAGVCALFLWRGLRDITVMVVDSGRDRPELETLIGPLIQRLFLRFELSAEQSHTQLLQQTERELANAQQHRDFNRMTSLRVPPPTDLCFNWVSSHEMPVLPRDEDVSDIQLRFREFPLERRGPLPGFGLLLTHDIQISGQLTYDPTVHQVAEVREYHRLLELCLQRMVRDSRATLGSQFQR